MRFYTITVNRANGDTIAPPPCESYATTTVTPETVAHQHKDLQWPVGIHIELLPSGEKILLAEGDEAYVMNAAGNTVAHLRYPPKQRRPLAAAGGAR